ncbi:MAG: hypothetical protein JWN11_180 [Hyphomicrobiales bacterium]|nr:hypothetical protein [Hyphomicrobiales bacterium]
MAKYLLAYHGGGMPDTPEEGQKIMAAWTQWMGGLGTSLVDPGNPIGPITTVASDGRASQGGGANPVTGYSVIEAPSLEAAVKMADGCPIFASGGSVEVGETFAAM